MTDRRTTEALAPDWKEARGVVALRLDQIHDKAQEAEKQANAALQEIRELRPYMRGVARFWAVLAFIAVTVVGAVLVTASRHFTLQALAPAVLTQTERTEEIADILADIPAGPGNRRLDGQPTVAAVRRALPQVRGISASEIESACLHVPQSCTPR